MENDRSGVMRSITIFLIFACCFVKTLKAQKFAEFRVDVKDFIDLSKDSNEGLPPVITEQLWIINGQEDQSLRYKTTIDVSSYSAGTNIEVMAAFWGTAEEYWTLPEYGGLAEVTCHESSSISL